jgi:hypothetical protein
MNENQVSPNNLLDTTDCLEAVGVFKGWKNLFFILVVLCLLFLQMCFLLVDTGSVEIGKQPCDSEPAVVADTSQADETEPGPDRISETPKEIIVEPNEPIEPDEPIEPNEPAEPNEPIEPDKPAEPNEPIEPDKPAEPNEPVEPNQPIEPNEPAEPNSTLEQTEPDPPIVLTAKTAVQKPKIIPGLATMEFFYGITSEQLAWLINLVNAVLILTATLYCLTLLFSLKVSMLGRLGGINHISRAFFLSLLMLVLLLPWQRIFGDLVLGAIYTPDELIQWYSAESDNIFDVVLYYLRFSGYPLLILILLIFSQFRSYRWAKAILRRLEII